MPTLRGSFACAPMTPSARRCWMRKVTRWQSVKRKSDVMNDATSSSQLEALEAHDSFESRHIGTSARDQREMLAALGFDSMTALIDAVVPAAIRRPDAMDLPGPLSEAEALERLRAMASRNV